MSVRVVVDNDAARSKVDRDSFDHDGHRGALVNA
jgi:hypothetical protein